MKVLVTGGAGYIGSHTVYQLIEAGHQVLVVDNLYSGHRWAVHPEADFVYADVADYEAMVQIFRQNKFDTVLHFAAHIEVPESVAKPLKYYQNNVAASANLLRVCVEAGVENFIFSSTAAVYGNPEYIPVNEKTTPAPINPYGTTKLITEWMLRDIAASSQGKFRYVALRYFNVAGARADGRIGQATPNATHLIKVACEAATGKRDKVSIFGTDYPTVDGTCVRDYIHVEDLARAHLDAMNYLKAGGASDIFNCGYGHGFSVREVLDCVSKVGGVDFPVVLEGRRPGDPANLIANSNRIREVLGWKPKLDDLLLICRSAYEWEKQLVGHLEENADQ